MNISNEKLINFYLKYQIDYEKILLNIVENIEKCFEETQNKIDLNLLLNEYTKLLTNNLKNINNESLVSSIKGKIKENDYFELLTNHLNYDIINTSSTSHSMDLLIKINETVCIRIDIKNYNTNIPSKEILKFHNDIILTKSHGILISDKTNISNKEHFTFDIIDNKYISFYICKNELNIENIKHAINIILNINNILDTKNSKTIDKKSLLKINELLIKYNNDIQNIKEHTTITLNLINKISMENICSLLNMTLINESIKENIIYKCDKCEEKFDTNRKLLNHNKKIHI